MPIHLKISSVKNMATETNVLTKNHTLEATEYSADSFVFYIPVKLSLGVLLSMECEIETDLLKEKFSITAKVLSSEQEAKQYRTHVHMSQYNRTLWSQFLATLKQKQVKIDKLFKAIKGET